MAQHLAQVQYLDEDRGHIRATTIDNMYTNAYISEQEDFEKVIAQGKASSSANIWGPALVMQSWGYQNLTDIFGDIPYSEALKGDIPDGPLKPKYDAQKDIYYGLLASLTTASTAMKTATDAGFGSADIVFKGNSARWVKFANSLRARMAMRISKADPAKAATELTAAFAGGLMTSNADNAILAYPGDGVFDNGWSGQLRHPRRPSRVEDAARHHERPLGSAREGVRATDEGRPHEVYGAAERHGQWDGGAVLQYHLAGRTIFYPGATVYGTFGTSAGKKTPAVLMTYAEVEFLAAEAAERGLGGQSGAAAHYAAGVTASITQWGGTAAEAAAYLRAARRGVRAGCNGAQADRPAEVDLDVHAGWRSVGRVASHGQSGVDQDGSEGVLRCPGGAASVAVCEQ